MNDAHLLIAAFGGTFLMMVGLNYFFNEKDVHWIASLEKGWRARPPSRASKSPLCWRSASSGD